MKHLAELKRLEESSGVGAGGLGNGGPANSGLGAVAAADVTDFESLVRGNVNGQRVNGLAARGNQVDIFADVSPAPSPAPIGAPPGGGGIGTSVFESAASFPTWTAPPASTSTFSSSSATTQVNRPVPVPRLSSTPSLTPSSSSSVLRSNQSMAGGSRPAASASASYLASPPASSPTLSMAPTTNAPTLRSFAPLQPSTSTSSSSTSARTVTSASLSHSTAPPHQQQPNYHLALSTTTLSSREGGLPPLQPTTSSLLAGRQPQPSQAAPLPPPAQPIQWNRVPSAAGGNAATFSPAPMAARPQQQQSQSPATSRPFPPGYNPSSASLVPVSLSSSSTMTPHANAGTKKPATGPGTGTGAMDFGAWADLDPLK